MAIASILGTGILGLPVTLADSGFQPFVISFLLCYVVQVRACLRLLVDPSSFSLLGTDHFLLHGSSAEGLLPECCPITGREFYATSSMPTITRRVFNRVTKTTLPFTWINMNCIHTDQTTTYQPNRVRISRYVPLVSISLCYQRIW